MISFDGRYIIEGNKKFVTNESFDFFYPNLTRNSFWELLKFAKTYSGNLTTRPQKECFLKDIYIGMVNLIHKAICSKKNSKDGVIHILTLRDGLLEEIQRSKICDIYFTGKTPRRLFWYYITSKNWPVTDIDGNEENEFSSIKIKGITRTINLHTLPTPANYHGKKATEAKMEKYKTILKL